MTSARLLPLLGLAIGMIAGRAAAAPSDDPDAFLSPDPVALAPACVGRWPRLLTDAATLTKLRERLRADPALANRFSPATARPFNVLATGSRELAPQLAQLETAALFYRLTGEPHYRKQVEQGWPLVRNLIEHPIHLNTPPNANDLDAGWSMRWIALTYDWLRQTDWPDAGLAELRTAIQVQAGGIYREFRAGRVFAYDQNHGYIPAIGLAMCGFALYGEAPEAPAWAGFSHAYLRRTLAVLGGDGFYYEGPSYYDYAFQGLALYGAMLRRVTGENVMDSPTFRNLEFFVAHCTLPGGAFVFDFGDWGPRKGQPGYGVSWHTFPTHLSTLPLWIAAADAEPSATRTAVLRWLPPPSRPNATPFAYDGSQFTLLYLAGRPLPVNSVPPSAAALPLFHYFPNHDALFWRSSWSDPQATAAYFQAGPPLGHAAAALARRFQDWRSNAGHVHPDSANFLIWTRGRFVAGDTGYTAVKWTRDHNTLLFDGQGQVNDGRYHSYRGIDAERLDRIRLENVWATPDVMAATAVFADAYAASLRLTSLRRHLILVAGKWGLIQDEAQSSEPHAVTWSWHTDVAPEPVAPALWHVQNGPAGATLADLTPGSRARVQPAWIDAYTGVPDHGEQLQRGFQFTLTTPAANQVTITEALVLNSAFPSAVRATRRGDGSVELSDGSDHAVIAFTEEASGRVTWHFRLGNGRETRSGP